MTVEHLFERDLTYLTKLFNFFSLFLFIVYPQSFFERKGVCFGAPESHIPTFVENGENVLCNYLHAMGGVRKEGWLGDIFMKLSFRLPKNLTSGTFGWMLEHSSHCAVIVADDDINDKEAIIEGILYHLQNCKSLHTFRSYLKVLWALMFFRFFSSFFGILTLPSRD